MLEKSRLAGCLRQVHGRCETVVTKFRPVPLTWHFCFARDGAAQLLPLFAAHKVHIPDDMP